jgi:hypothetical protein
VFAFAIVIIRPSTKVLLGKNKALNSKKHRANIFCLPVWQGWDEHSTTGPHTIIKAMKIGHTVLPMSMDHNMLNKIYQIWIVHFLNIRSPYGGRQATLLYLRISHGHIHDHLINLNLG